MTTRLIQIPGVAPHHQHHWQVRILEIDARNLVLEKLTEWSDKSPADYKKIMKVLCMIGQVDRIRDEKKVKKSKNSKHDDLYEIRADKGHARLMFFYSEQDQAVVVCTNTYWKAKTSQREQDLAFQTCHQLKKIYETHIQQENR